MQQLSPLLRKCNEVVWHLDPLVAGGDGYIYLTVQVTDTVEAGDILRNEVRISTSDPDSYLDDNVYVRTDTVVEPRPDVSVEKFLIGAPGAPGGEMEYEIYFETQGNTGVQGVTITDTLPVSLTYVSWDGDICNAGYCDDMDWWVTPIVTGSQVIWHVGRLDFDGYGYIHLRVRITDTASVGDQIVNVVQIGADETEIDLTDNVYTHTVTLTDRTRDMYIYKYVDGYPGAPGGEMKYHLYFRNQGNWTATGVTITDTLPSSATLVSWSGSLWNPGYVDLDETISATISGDQIVWHVGSVVADGSGEIDLVVRVDSAARVRDKLINEVEISTSDVDDNPDNNTDEHITRVILPWRSLYIEKYLNSLKGTPGGEMEYGIYFDSYGNQTATNVTISDTLPPGASLLSWYGELRAPDYIDLDQAISATVSGGQVTWNVGSLPPDSWGYIWPTIHVPASASVGERLVNVVEISGDGEDLYPTDNVYTHTSILIAPEIDVGVYKFVNSAPSANAGTIASAHGRPGVADLQALQTAEYTPASRSSSAPAETASSDVHHTTVTLAEEIEYGIRFDNYGNTAADAIIVTDTLPANVTYVSWSGYANNPGYVDLDQTISVTVNGNQLVWNLGSVVGGGWGYIYPRVRVAPTAHVGEVLVNQVDISTSDTESTYANNSSAVSVTVLYTPCVPLSGVDFNFSPANPLVGQVVAFTGSVTQGTEPISYTWNLGDGSGVMAGNPVNHSFPLTITVQTYTVTMTAANACPSQQVVEKAVTIWPRTIYLPLVVKH